ncbi:MAG TPA: ATP-dependent Clp protease adaptor ClpS, partial [Myxococcota bacterium]|nr:ATP-dependent Clp protease adaptor ClpS [Myxococcota bacterium]
PNKPAPPDPGRDRGVLTETRPKLKRPPKFKVIVYNDDFTPMEFVVRVLEQIFQKSPAEATQLMLQIHRGGFGIAGVYVLEVAETKVVAVHQAAERNGYPLRAGVEQE